ncbi:MAG: Rrf2 family transcriptional regulator [Acidobacteria bacterium]|nr:Rrf2 family transcriptional regulator [Acidobacteriota bacterium]
MNLSRKSEYALLAVFDLACQAPGAPVRIADVARRQKIPQKFLELILASLKHGNFVESRRGAEGGYLLALPAERFTVGEVLRHIEGGRTPRSHGRRQSESPLSDLWARVDEAIWSVVGQTTFAELRDRWRERQSACALSWDI